MKVTARIVADVKPEVKQKLQELADHSGLSKTEILSQLIKTSYKTNGLEIKK